MKERWKLVKPENDFIALEDDLRNLHFAQRTYQMFGTRSPYVSVGNYSKAFQSLENVVKGTEPFVFWEPNEFCYGESQNIHSIDDLKKLWSMRVAATICRMLFYIGQIKSDESNFNNYPIWLKTRCEFAVHKFMPLFKDYLRKDEDCGYLADMTFIPMEVKRPVSLPDKKF